MAIQKYLPEMDTRFSPAQPVADRATASLIEGLGDISGEIIKGYQEGRTERSIAEIAEETAVAKEMVAQRSTLADQGPVPQGEGFSTYGVTDELAAEIQRMEQRSGDRFRAIARAVEAGALPENAASLQAEAEIRRLIRQTPGFAPEIRETARRILGFDPSGYAIQEMLGIGRQQTTTLTAFDKAEQEVDKIYRQMLPILGDRTPSRDSIRYTLGAAELRAKQQSLSENEVALGNRDARDHLSEMVTNVGVDSGNLLTRVMQAGQEGGIDNPSTWRNAAVAEREMHLQNLRQEAARLGLDDPEWLAAQERTIVARYDSVISSIENNDLGKVLANHNETVTQLYKFEGNQSMPLVMKRVAQVGPDLAGQMLEMELRTPQQRDLLLRHASPLVQQVFATDLNTTSPRTRAALKAMTDILDGRQPLVFTPSVSTPEEAAEVGRVIQEQVIEPEVYSSKNPKVREAFVERTMRGPEPLRALSKLLLKVAPSEATEKEQVLVEQQFATYIGKTAAGEDLPGNLIDAVARDLMNSIGGPGELFGGISVPTLELSQGRWLQTTSPRLLDGVISQGRELPSMRRLQMFLDAAERGWSWQMNQMPPEEFRQFILNRVTDRMATLAESQADERAQRWQPLRDAVQRFMNPVSTLTGGSPRGEAEGLEGFLMGWESLLTERKDEGEGHFSIGYGRDSRSGRDIPESATPEQAREWLREDIAEAAAAVDSLVTVDLQPHERDALISLVYNIGRGAFAKSKALAALNRGDRDTFLKEAFSAEEGWTKTTKNGKKVRSAGLVRRRAAEMKLFLNSDYSARP